MTAPDDPAPHDETCARCDRRICVCGCQCATCVPVSRPPIPPPNPLLMATLDGNPAVPLNDPAAARPAHADAAMADLGAAITEFGELREAMWEAVATVRDASPRRADDADTYDVVDAVLALPEVRALLDAATKVQRVEALVARQEETAARRRKLAEKFYDAGRWRLSDSFRTLARQSDTWAARIRAALDGVA